jgi:DNA-directed RNA polymerase specialized sigma subunit
MVEQIWQNITECDPKWVEALRNGDRSMIQAIIVAYIPLALKLAKNKARIFPGDIDDYISTALYTLVQRVHKPNLRDNNIGAYLNSHIKYALMKKSRKNKTLPNNIPSKRRVSYEMIELIMKSAQTDKERRILVLRSQGYCDREIAEQLGSNVSEVWRTRQECYKRYKELEDGLSQHRRNTSRGNVCRTK